MESPRLTVSSVAFPRHETGKLRKVLERERTRVKQIIHFQVIEVVLHLRGDLFGNARQGPPNSCPLFPTAADGSEQGGLS